MSWIIVVLNAVSAGPHSFRVRCVCVNTVYCGETIFQLQSVLVSACMGLWVGSVQLCVRSYADRQKIESGKREREKGETE